MHEPLTLRELRRRLVADSIERGRWMTKLILLVRKEERDRVLSTMEKARGRREAGGE